MVGRVRPPDLDMAVDILFPDLSWRFYHRCDAAAENPADPEGDRAAETRRRSIGYNLPRGSGVKGFRRSGQFGQSRKKRLFLRRFHTTSPSRRDLAGRGGVETLYETFGGRGASCAT